MNTAVMVVGLITLVSVCIGILTACCSYFNGRRDEREAVRFAIAKEKAAKEIGQNLRNASWWFGESVEATRVLDIIGEKLAQYGAFDEDKVREKWQAEVKTAREQIAAQVDEVGAFAATACVVEDGAAAFVADLYVEYCTFCDERNFHPTTTKAFLNRLLVTLPTVTREHRGGRVVLIGVKLLQSGKAEAPAEAMPNVEAAVVDALVTRFLTWPLPETVCSDQVATVAGYPHRTGTNLLTATESRQMIEYLLAGVPSA